MKLLKFILIVSSVFFVCSCTDDSQDSSASLSSDIITSNDTATSVITSQIVDYSSSPYIGTGSHYYVTAGSGESLQSMHFFFDPDGIGAWGTVKTVAGQEVKELYIFHFVLTGEVNVSWVETKSGEKGNGYFTTDYTGQVFVSLGIHF